MTPNNAKNCVVIEDSPFNPSYNKEKTIKKIKSETIFKL